MKKPKRLFKKRRRSGVIEPERYNPDDMLYIATHEAGHAVAVVVLGLELKSVDVRGRKMPDGTRSAGFTELQVPSPDIASKGEDGTMPYLIQSLAGAYAEAKVNPRTAEYGLFEQDLESAYGIAAAALMTVGVGGDPEKMRVLIETAIKLTTQLVDEYWSAIERVAVQLVKRQELRGDEVAAIVNAVRSLDAISEPSNC